MSEILKELMLFPGATADKVARMAKYLTGAPNDALRWAVTELVKTSPYLPSVSEILRKVGEYRPAKGDPALRMLLTLELHFYQTGEVQRGEFESLAAALRNAGRMEMAQYVLERCARYEAAR